MKYAIHTQYMTNSGSAGQYSPSDVEEGESNYWKCQMGSTYIVSDIARLSDAIAYVAKMYTTTASPHFMEFVTSWQTEEEWHEVITRDENCPRYSDFLKSEAIHCGGWS